MTNVSDLTLNTGAPIPQVGFGVFQIPPEETAEAVGHALDAGYRHVDTARAYSNEQQVGEAVAGRDDVFVTTKLWNDDQGSDSATRALDQSLDLLGREAVDLYLIHWPMPADDRYVETWRALERAHADGRAKAIGVSNFEPDHLQRLIDECDVVPAVNQIELHPRLQQATLREFHAAHGIRTEAWSPLAQGELFEDETLLAIAEELGGRSVAQVVLRWHVQLGNIVIPKSATPERIRSNIDVFGFELTDEQMGRIATLDAAEDGRIGPHPDSFGS